MYILPYLHVHPALSSCTSCLIFMYILPYLHEVYPAPSSWSTSSPVFMYILPYLHVILPSCTSCPIIMYIWHYLHVHPALSSWSTCCPTFMYIRPYLHEVHPALPSCSASWPTLPSCTSIQPSCTACPICMYILPYFMYIQPYLHVHPALSSCTFFPVFIPGREAGDVWCLPPVWNLRAVIWFHYAISSLVLLPSPVTLSVLLFSACWPFLLNFFQKILQYFSLRDRLFCMAPV